MIERTLDEKIKLIEKAITDFRGNSKELEAAIGSMDLIFRGFQ